MEGAAGTAGAMGITGAEGMAGAAETTVEATVEEVEVCRDNDNAFIGLSSGRSTVRRVESRRGSE